MLSVESSEKFLENMISSLKKLEYRGYDSWGFASLDRGSIHIEKRVGRISSPSSLFTAHIGVSHTRWATHGGVTAANAHPHVDCHNEIAIVHNGIIENYLELREQLIKDGHVFVSQTDSEVIAHLFEEMDGSLFNRAKSVAKFLRGSFSLVAMSSAHENEMVAIKNESPLAIGIAENEVIFASDPLAFIDRTNTVVFLNDGEIAHAKRSNNRLSFEFFNYQSGRIVHKDRTRLEWKPEEIHLGRYNHYMLKEIMEQPATIRNGIDLERAGLIAGRIKGRRVIAIACGTARHSAVIGKHILHKVAKFQMDVMMAHEFVYFIQDLDRDSIVLAVSQSGETADVLECVRKARQRGMTVLSIVNVPSSTLARESEAVYYTNCGPEIAVASTKAFSNQVLAFYLIAYALAGRTAEIKNRINRIISELQQRLAYYDQKAQEVAAYLQNKHDVYMIGRGINFPVALEGSLKLKEISYLHAEGMPAGELKHGTLALIEDGTPVILVNPADYTYEGTISSGLETKARGAQVIGISNRPHPLFNMWIQLPDLDRDNEIFYPLVETVPLQLIAYHTAVLLGRDVDKPRNLAKSVTVK